jgi:hypothetical protein
MYMSGPFSPAGLKAATTMLLVSAVLIVIGIIAFRWRPHGL